jgi:hypothetical protein
MIKQPAEKLREKLDAVVTHFRNAAPLVNEIFTLARKEGFSEKEIGQMIRNRLVQLGYNPRSIRRLLPPTPKDLTKVRKDNLVIHQDNSDGKSYEDILSSCESRNEFDENQRDESFDSTDDLQTRIRTLEEQLNQERDKNEDLTIQSKNATISNSELRGKLDAVRNATNILVLAKNNFPQDSNCVFTSEDFVFAVKYKGSKVLDISVVTQNQVQGQDQYGIDNY